MLFGCMFEVCCHHDNTSLQRWMADCLLSILIPLLSVYFSSYLSSIYRPRQPDFVNVWIWIIQVFSNQNKWCFQPIGLQHVSRLQQIGMNTLLFGLRWFMFLRWDQTRCQSFTLWLMSRNSNQSFFFKNNCCFYIFG